MKYLVIFLVLIGFLSPSVAFAQYLGDVEFYHLPLTAKSKQYSILSQSNTNYFTDVVYDSKANSLIFSTSASEDFIDTYTITMNEQTFSDLLTTDYAKTPDSVLVLINGVEQPYRIFKDNDVISWRFYATISSDEVELLPSTPRFDTGTYKLDKIPNGSPKIYPPLKQSHVGIAIENIQCNDDLVLLQKYDGTPACVTYHTGTKLLDSGWATCGGEVSHGRDHPCGPRSSPGIVNFNSEKYTEVSIITIPLGAVTEGHEYLNPDEITVVLGKNNTVTWINQDDAAHRFNSNEGGENFWTTGIIYPNKESTVVFNQTGIFEYHGEPHPWMIGKVIVLEE